MADGLDKPLANGERALALYNSTDALATDERLGQLDRAGAARGLPDERRVDRWHTAGRYHHLGGVPAHGTVVYRVRPESKPTTLAPSVVVGAAVSTLVPGTAGSQTLNTTVTNRGLSSISNLTVATTVPEGWTVTTTDSTQRSGLRSNASLETAWTVTVPDGTAAGEYAITIEASYRWGTRHQAASTTSELIATVVTAPDDGRRYLSTISPASSTNGLGAIESDQSNGGYSPGDGSLVTVGGNVYTRGLGTATASEIAYYIGGQCSQLTTDLGIDDTDSAGVAATFTVYADDVAVATSDPMTKGDSAITMTVDVANVSWLRLVTSAADGVSAVLTDWASPILTCGSATGDDPVLPTEQTLYSFESGTDGWTIANADSGGTVAQSSVFHTDGNSGLAVSAPAGGNWFGVALPEALDLTAMTTLKVDIKGGTAGSTGEIAVQVGPDSSWCQGSLWAWTNAGATKTISETFDKLSCPTGVTLDQSQITGVWVFLNSADVYIDNVRAD